MKEKECDLLQQEEGKKTNMKFKERSKKKMGCETRKEEERVRCAVAIKRWEKEYRKPVKRKREEKD